MILRPQSSATGTTPDKSRPASQSPKDLYQGATIQVLKLRKSLRVSGDSVTENTSPPIPTKAE